MPTFFHLCHKNFGLTCLREGTCWVYSLLFCSYLYQTREFKYPRSEQSEYYLLLPTVLCTQQMPSRLPGRTDKGTSKYPSLKVGAEQLSK